MATAIRAAVTPQILCPCRPYHYVEITRDSSDCDTVGQFAPKGTSTGGLSIINSLYIKSSDQRDGLGNKVGAAADIDQVAGA